MEPTLGDLGTGGANSTAEAVAMALSAAAQEAIGFSDDQFHDMSTSGASLYDPHLLDASNNSNRFYHNAVCSKGLTSPSRRKVLLTASSVKSRDELSLSTSGMSLASLGALSRSARRPSSGMCNVDEALDDSIAWRETWHKVLNREEEKEGSGDNNVSSPGSRGTDEKLHAAGGSSDGAKAGHEPERRPECDLESVDIEAARRALTEGVIPGADSAGVAEVPPGRFQELSLPVAELRQQSFSRRQAISSVRTPGPNSPPPLPVGVDLAPTEETEQPLLNSAAEIAVASEVPSTQQQQQQSQLPRNGSPGSSFLESVPDNRARRPHARSWGGPQRSGKRQTSESGVDDSRGGSDSFSVQPKGMRRAAAVLARRLGVSRHHRTDSAEDSSAYLDADGTSSMDGWSAESCGHETYAANMVNSSSPPIQQLANTSRKVSSGSEQGQSTETKRRGLFRGRLGQVLGGRCRGGHKDEKPVNRQGAVTGGNRSVTSVLQPTGGDGGGFAFLPSVSGPLELSPAPETTPEWLRTRSAPPGSVTPGCNAGAVCHVGGSVPSPVTPLGRSNRSFDPNRSPQHDDPSAPNAFLSPQLMSRPALERVASFDANRSSRSWFDTSAESSQRPLDMSGDADMWKHHSQQQEQPPERPQLCLRPFSEAFPEVDLEREEKAAAVARALDAATAAADAVAESSVATSSSLNGDVAAPSDSHTALASSIFDEAQLAIELSDLSVSSGRRALERGQLPSPASAAPENQAAMISASEGSVETVGGAPVTVSAAPVGDVSVIEKVENGWSADSWGGEQEDVLLHQHETLVSGSAHSRGFDFHSTIMVGASEHGGHPPTGSVSRMSHCTTDSSSWTDVRMSCPPTGQVAGETSVGQMDMGGTASITDALITESGLGLTPNPSQALPFKGVKSQSEVDLLQQMGCECDSISLDFGRGNAGDSLGWKGGKVIQGGLGAAPNGMRRCVTTSPTPGLVNPPAFPQRSISLDHSLSESRSRRNADAVVNPGVTAESTIAGLSAGISAGYSTGVSVGLSSGVSTFTSAGGPALGCHGAQPSLDGDENLAVLPLSGVEQDSGGSAEEGFSRSWSALQAMIPVPTPSREPTTRASIPMMSTPSIPDGQRRASDADLCLCRNKKAIKEGDEYKGTKTDRECDGEAVVLPSAR